MERGVIVGNGTGEVAGVDDVTVGLSAVVGSMSDRFAGVAHDAIMKLIIVRNTDNFLCIILFTINLESA